MTDRQEVSGRRLIRNTAANAVGSGVVAVVALVMTPFLLRRLGAAEYGVWLLATGLTFGSGYLGLADLGLQQASVRFIAEARSRGDAQAVSEIVSTTAVLFAALGTVLAVVLGLLSYPLADLFNLRGAARDAGRKVFLIVGLQIAVDLPAAALLALVEGAQRYAQLRLIDIGSRVLWAVATVVVVLGGRGVVALAVVSLLVALLAAAASWAAAKRIQPGLRVDASLASRRTVAQVLRYGSSLLVLRVVSVVYRQMDRAVIGIALTAVAVARYEVAYKIHATTAILLAIGPSAVMPAAAYTGAAGDHERLRALYLRGTKYAVAISLPVTVAALFYAKALITTWVGPQYADLTGVTRLFLVYPLLAVVHTIGLTILVGIGRMREMLVLNVVAVLLNLVLSVALVGSLGIAGVVWGTIAGYAVLWLPYMRLFYREFDVDAPTWVRAVVVPNLPALGAQVLFSMATLRLAEDAGQLWEVLLVFAASCAVSAAVFFATGLRREERRTLRQVVQRQIASEHLAGSSAGEHPH